MSWPLLAALLYWLPVPALRAQVPDSAFTLQQCIAYSLKHHPNSRIYANEARIVRQQNRESLAYYLPKINGTVTLDDNLKRQVTVIPAGAFGPEETTIQFGNQYNTNASVQLDQVIYDKAALTALSGMKVNEEMAAIRRTQSDEELVYQTASAYYRVLTLIEQEQLLSVNADQYSELLKVLSLQHEKGVIRKIDLDRVRVSLNNITSQRTLVQTNLQLALNQLKNAMGMPLEHPLRISGGVDLSLQAALPSGPAFDPRNRVDYRLLERNITLQELDLKRRQALYQPTLSFYGRYGAMAFGDDFFGSFGRWFDYAAVGLRLQVPIFSGFRTASQVEQSKLNLSNALENQRLSAANMHLQHQNAHTQLLSALTSLNANKENLQLASEVFGTTALQYRSGTAPLSDFLNAEYAYKEAQSNYITTLLSFLSARLDLEKAQGTLLQYTEKL